MIAGVVLGGIVAGGVLALVINAAAVDRHPPPAAPSAADSSVTGTFVLPPSPGSPGAAFGSAAALGALADSAVQAPRTGSLAVAAPGAEIRIDGRPVAQGSWSSDTLPPRTYEVRARVLSTMGPCPSSDTTTQVTVYAGGSSQLRLRPRPCGGISIVPTPNPAQFRLRPVDGGPEQRGVFPEPRPRVLPAGRYRLVIYVPLCKDYDDEVVITAGATLARKIPLMCGG
jgi:hypothetical protein